MARLLLANAVLIGNKYKPTFNSNLSHFIVKDINEEKGLAITEVYPNNGKAFSDFIELKYLHGSIETGDYELIGREESASPEAVPIYISLLDNTPKNLRGAIYEGVCCARCVNRARRNVFCEKHHLVKDCHRFKFDRYA